MHTQDHNAGMPRHCQVCGAVLDSNRLDGLCPACTWTAVVTPSPPDAAGTLTPPSDAFLLSIPGLEVIEEIARGGMGVVYRARQLNPDRVVALKMLLPHRTLLAEMRERFRLETRAIAALDHPAILPVYQVGEYERLPFFTMKYVSGGSLATRREAYRGRYREIAELMATLADAIHFAHEHGVLHRDLKPGNILFDDTTRPYVSDFGLAKFIGIDNGLTQSAHLLGTPHYVAPEVASRCAKFATTASDIYSLGAILYELLTGRLPFDAEGVPPLLRKIAEEEPARIMGQAPQAAATTGKRRTARRSQGGPVVPRQLQVICLKCMAKDPAQRYPSAHDLAADLRRWLEGRPILAQPVSWGERVLNWAKRKPAVAVLVGLLCLALAGCAVMLTWANRRLQHALSSSHVSLQESLLIQARLERKSGRIGQQARALSLVERAVTVSSLPEQTDPDRQLRLRTELAGALALPDLHLAARWPVHFRTWDSTVAFNDDLSLYAAPALEGGFSIWATPQQRVVWHFPGALNNLPVRFKFGPAGVRWPPGSTPDARWVAAMFQDGHAEIQAIGSRRPPLRFGRNARSRVNVEFVPGTTQVLVAESEEGLVLHDLTDGTWRHLIPRPATVTALTAAPCGERLACFSGKEVKVLEIAGGQRLWSVPVPHGTVELAWSSDSRLLAIAESVQPFEITVLELGPAASPPFAAGSPSDQPRVPAQSVNGNFNLVMLETKLASNTLSARILAHFQDHELSANRLAFHPDGRSLLSVGWDNRLVWRQLVQSGLRLLGHAGWRALDFSADGRRLAYEPGHGEVGLLETTPSRVFFEWDRVTPPDEEACMLAVSPDGRHIATSSVRGIQLWDPATRAQVAHFALPKQYANVRVAFHPSVTAVLCSALGLGIVQIDLRHDTTSTGKPVVQFGDARSLGSDTNLLLQHFAPDARSLVVLEACDALGTTSRVWLWPDADPARALLLADTFPLQQFELTGDERWAVSSHLTQPDIWVWDPITRSRVAHLNIAHATEFRISLDGRWLLVTTRERHQLWEIGSWRAGPHWANSVARGTWAGAFSADGAWVATPTAEGHVEIRSVPGAAILADLPPPQLLRLHDLAFSPDRRRLYLWQSTGRLLEWDLQELRRELARRGLDWRD